MHRSAMTGFAGGVTGHTAADIEDTVVKCLKEHLAARQDKSTTGGVRLGDRGAVAQLIASIAVCKDRLIVRFKSDHADEASDSPDDRSLTIPCQKPPSKRPRQILLPHMISRTEDLP